MNEGEWTVERGAQAEAQGETLVLTREELQRARIRRTTSRGTDIAVALDDGEHLHSGDVLARGNQRVRVEQAAERVIAADVPASTSTAIVMGHIIGNMHRPVSVDGSTVRFPIHADSELETFARLFGPLGKVRMRTETVVFSPSEGVSAHAH